MDEYDAVARVYDPDLEVAATIAELQRTGFDMNRISLVGKDYNAEQNVGAYGAAGERIRLWRQLAEFWGGSARLLVGSAFYFIADIGPVIVFGPLVGFIVRALERSVVAGELSALGAGLRSIGIATQTITEYETAVKFDKLIVVVHGRSGDVSKGKHNPASFSVASNAPARRNEPRQRA